MTDRPPRVLLIRLREIGDVVFTTPALRALRDHFPGAHLSYLVEPNAAPVVAANRAIDEVIVSPRQRGWRGLLADLKLGADLRRKHFDLAIDFHGGPRASLLTWLSRAPVRLGYDVSGRSWMYTRTAERPRTLRARHSVENQWDLLALLGIAPPDRTRYPVEMTVEPATIASVEAELRSRCQWPGVRLVVMHVSAGNPFRRWPIEAFARVAAALANSASDIRVVVTSGPSDAAAARQVIDAAHGELAPLERDRVLAFEDLSLQKLRALTERAALFIGGDSGPMHIAATTTVPIVALYGPTLPARSEPWRPGPDRTVAMEIHGLPCRPCDQRVCAPGDYRCLGQISPAAVIEAARRLMMPT